MTDQQFDKFFRDSFRDHQSKVPDDMWSRIQPEEETRRRVFFIPKWYALVAVLVLMAGGYFTWQLVQEGKTTNTVAKTETKNDLQNEHDTMEQARTNDKDEIDKGNADNEKPGSTVAASSQNQIPSSGNNKGKDAANTYTKDNNASFGKKNKLTANTAQPASGLFGNNKNETENKVAKDANTVAGEMTFANTPGQKNSDNNATANNTATLSKSDDAVKPDSNKASVATAKAAPEEIALAVNKQKLARNGKRGITIEAYASPELAFKTSSVNYTPYIAVNPNASTLTNQSYLEESYKTQQDKVYKQRVSYSAGLRIAIPIAKKLSLKTGLQYAQINEKFDFEANDEQRDYALITARYFNAGNGTFLPIFDTTSFIASGFHKKVTYNTYRSLNVPVLVSYETGNNSITWGATAGAVININSWYNGDMLSAEFKAASIKSQNIYKRNTGVSLYAGAQVAKRLSNQWQFFAEPHVQYALSNFTNSKSYVQQKFSTVGLAVGLRYNLSAIRQHK